MKMLLFNKLATMSERRTFKQNEYMEYAFSGIKNNYFEASSFDEFFDESLEQYSRMLDNTQDMSDSDGPEFVFPFKYNGDVNIFQISLMPNDTLQFNIRLTHGVESPLEKEWLTDELKQGYFDCLTQTTPIKYHE